MAPLYRRSDQRAHYFENAVTKESSVRYALLSGRQSEFRRPLALATVASAAYRSRISIAPFRFERFESKSGAFILMSSPVRTEPDAKH